HARRAGSGGREALPGHGHAGGGARFKGCNGCWGLGQRLRWPTLWKPHPGDIRPVHTITTDHVPAAVLTADGEWHQPWEARAIGDVAAAHQRRHPPLAAQRRDLVAILARVGHLDELDLGAHVLDRLTGGRAPRASPAVVQAHRSPPESA